MITQVSIGLRYKRPQTAHIIGNTHFGPKIKQFGVISVCGHISGLNSSPISRQIPDPFDTELKFLDVSKCHLAYLSRLAIFLTK